MTTALVREALAAGATRDYVGYADLRALASLDPAVAEVVGSTRYQVEGDVRDAATTARVVDRRGVATALTSRTDKDPTLKGTKHLVASQRRLQVARGRSDDRTVVIIPEVKDHHTVGLTLLHVVFRDQLTASELRGVLRGYGDRYEALADAVTETEPTFDEERLATLKVADLLCEPVESLADHWRDGAPRGK